MKSSPEGGSFSVLYVPLVVGYRFKYNSCSVGKGKKVVFHNKVTLLLYSQVVFNDTFDTYPFINSINEDIIVVHV